MQEEGKDKEQNQAGWVFKPGGAGASSSPASTDAPGQTTKRVAESVVSWSASEYIAHPKNTSWFAMLAAASVVLAVVVYLATKDYVSTAVIVVLGVIVGVFAARQPQVLTYSLDKTGIHIGERFYAYNAFKSFSVVEEGAFSHISLLPLKRFMPQMAVHYAPDDEEKIVQTLADYLPYEEHKRDLVESFSRRVRF
jgi:hypothetical protein